MTGFHKGMIKSVCVIEIHGLWDYEIFVKANVLCKCSHGQVMNKSVCIPLDQ